MAVKLKDPHTGVSKKGKKKRHGVHSKKNNSGLKSSKRYNKKSVGQGK